MRSSAQAILHHAPIGIAVMDWAGRFEHGNPAYCQRFGYAGHELLALNLESLVHPDDRTACLQEVARLRGGDAPSVRIECRFVHKLGTTLRTRQHLSVLPDESGGPARLLALVVDIAEEARAQTDRTGAERLAALAHELRNALAPIRNGVQILSHPQVTREATAQAVQMIDRQSEALVRLVDGLNGQVKPPPHAH